MRKIVYLMKRQKRSCLVHDKLNEVSVLGRFAILATQMNVANARYSDDEVEADLKSIEDLESNKPQAR